MTTADAMPAKRTATQLKPYQWKAGQSGNPTGRRQAGLQWLEWINTMAAWTKAEVTVAANDKDGSIAYRAAAKDTLRWLSKTPGVANAASDRILDRSIGKPLQRQAIEQHHGERIEQGDIGQLSETEMLLIAGIRARLAGPTQSPADDAVVPDQSVDLIDQLTAQASQPASTIPPQLPDQSVEPPPTPIISPITPQCNPA